MSITPLPKLRSSFIGASALLIICSAAHAEPVYTFKDTPGDHLDVCRNGIPLVRYQYAYNNSSPEKLQETYKPIFHVMNQKGTAPITKGAGGDFTHHRGWFIGWMKITTPSGTVDRWHMKGGSIIHQKFLSQKADAKSATFTAALNWEGTTPEPILSEERTYIVTEAPAPAYVQVEMRSKLKALTGETKLDGLTTADVAVGFTAFLPALLISSIAVAKMFQLVTGTDAENADPTAGTLIIRPDDYNASTNAKVWKEKL
jgi:hypothetical protein